MLGCAWSGGGMASPRGAHPAAAAVITHHTWPYIALTAANAEGGVVTCLRAPAAK